MTGFRALHIVYEDPARLPERLRPLGLSGEAARQVGDLYLAQVSEFAERLPQIEARFGAGGVEVFFREIGDLDECFSAARHGKPHGNLLWNLTDGFRYYRGSHLGSLAALIETPSFGSPPEAQLICQDKFKCLALAQALGLATPPGLLYRGARHLAGEANFRAAHGYFVKPNTLGGKIGIWPDSHSADLRSAEAVAERIFETYRDDALIQAFVPGDDVRVSYLDIGVGQDCGVYRMVKDDNGATGADDFGFVTMAEGDAYRRHYVDLEDTAARDSVASIRRAVKKLSEFFSLQDYFAVDFRLTPSGAPCFLEFEVCPTVTGQDFTTYLEGGLGVGLDEGLWRATALSHARQAAGCG